MLSAKSLIVLAAAAVAVTADHHFTLRNNCGFGINMSMWVHNANPIINRRFMNVLPVSVTTGLGHRTMVLSLLQSVPILLGTLRFLTVGTVAYATTVTATVVVP